MSADGDRPETSPEEAPRPSPPTGGDLARTALREALAEARRRAVTGGRGATVPIAGRRGPPRLAGDSKEPEPVGATVRRLLEARGWQVRAAVAAVTARWAEIVGPEIAAHTVPGEFRDGELVVAADSTAWATQLRLLAPALVRRLAEELGPDIVRCVRVQGPAAPTWRRGPRRVPGLGPRDTYG